MPDLERQLDDVIERARRGDWSGYRRCLGTLREALAQHAGGDEYAIAQRQLDTLFAAAPQHDPEGCIAELESLAAALRGRGLSAAGMPVPPLDLRGLQPPEPIVRIFEALERAPEEPLRAILPHEPVPLYALLRERGFTFSGAPRADGGYELLIERTGGLG
jgi:uncharacterized protein (DUF2249 family)